MSRKITVRIDQRTAESLALLVDTTQRSVSDLVRAALTQLCAHPETLGDLLTVEDTRTPEQAASWERNFASLTDPARVNALVAKYSQRMRQ